MFYTVLFSLKREITIRILRQEDNTMIENFINALKEFSANTPYIESVIIVGFYVRGTNKVLSDGYKIVLDKKDYFEDLTL